MAYLSVPSPGKWISDLFGKNMFRPFLQRFFGPTFFEKMDLRRVLWPKCQVKKVSYIDPLVMRFSPKSEFLIGNFHQNFSFLVKPYFLFLQYRKSVLKKTQIFGPLFEPCSSCVAVDSFFPEKHDFWKKRPPQMVIFRSFLTIFVQVPQCRFFLGWVGGGEGGRRRRHDVATNLRLPGPSPITPRDRIPREGPPHLDIYTYTWSYFCVYDYVYLAQLESFENQSHRRKAWA